MASEFFKKITQGLGKSAGLIANKTAGLKEDVISGYKQSRMKKCIWCKNEFLIPKLKPVSEKYLMCEYCLEGLAAAEVMMPDKYKLQAGQIIDAMLARAAEDKNRYSAAYNSFIMQANITIDELFSNDTQNKK